MELENDITWETIFQFEEAVVLLSFASFTRSLSFACKVWNQVTKFSSFTTAVSNSEVTTQGVV